MPKLKPLRSTCPISSALDYVGDRWSLLILRDIGLFSKHRNKDFQGSGEGIPTNILAARLKKLQSDGLIRKEPYQDNPPRYDYLLTPAGRDLLPVLRELARWSERHVAGVRRPKGLKGVGE